MKPFFKQLRESACKVAQSWGDNNGLEVDLDSAEIHFFGPFRGRVFFAAMTRGGMPKEACITFQEVPAGTGIAVFAQGASVEKFSLELYRLDWQAKAGQATRDNQGLHVSRVIHENAQKRAAACRSGASCWEHGCPKCGQLEEVRHGR